MCEAQPQGVDSEGHLRRCTCQLYFEGVCVTAVILATVRGEGRLRAAGRYIVSGGSGGSAGSADEFQIVHFIYVFTQNLLGPHSGAMFF